MDNNRFLTIAKHKKDKKKTVINLLLAFLGGAVMAVLGQGEFDLLTKVFNLDKKLSMMLVSMTFILLAAILTAFSAYKKIAQIFGAGLFIPITGFANSMVSSALEFRSEGPITGIGSKVFTLAGSVIFYGIIGSFVYGLFYYLLGLMGIFA